MDAREWLETNGTGDSGLVTMDIAIRMMNRFAAAVLREMAVIFKSPAYSGAQIDLVAHVLEREAAQLEGSGR
jgi:hypothetical protein